MKTQKQIDRITDFFESEGFEIEYYEGIDKGYVELKKSTLMGFEMTFNFNGLNIDTFKEEVDNFDIEHEMSKWIIDGEYNGMSYLDMYDDFSEFKESLKQTLNRLETL